jgi:uncharacterized protein (DUF1697 family)
MTRYVALLRGVNVGGRHSLGMARLRELLTRQGHADVRTLLQSGNVVLGSDLAPPDLERALREQIEAEVGFPVPVVVRTAAELDQVLTRDPLGDVVTDPRRHLVTFLSGEPLRRLAEHSDLAPERAILIGREIYSWHPDGIGRSRLAEQLTDRTLGVTATARNWSTLLRLRDLATST